MPTSRELTSAKPRALCRTWERCFVSFVLLGTMIILNLFIGVIISSMEEAQAEREAEGRRRHMDQDGEITVGDEIGLLEEEITQLGRRLSQLRERSNRENPWHAH